MHESLSRYKQIIKGDDLNGQLCQPRHWRNGRPGDIVLKAKLHRRRKLRQGLQGVCLSLISRCALADSSGRVDRRTGQAVAIKIIDVENAEDEVEDIIQEISILSELHSPYVTQYHGSFLKGSDLWIIMEFCSGGSCADLLKPGLIAEEYICIILRELLLGLEYLHTDKKLHRDIKGTSH